MSELEGVQLSHSRGLTLVRNELLEIPMSRDTADIYVVVAAKKLAQPLVRQPSP
jgi:hypothetical protein